MERKIKIQTSAFFIIGMMMVMSISSQFQNALSDEGTPVVSDFLQVGDDFAPEYYFNAQGACVLGCNIKDIAVTSLTLDGKAFELSYGYNIFGIDMGDELSNHHISLAHPEYFSRLYVQNLILSQNIIQLTELNSKMQILPFKASGLVHFLIRNDFHLDNLKLIVDSYVLKDFQSIESTNNPSSLNLESIGFEDYTIDLLPGDHIACIESKMEGYVQVFIFTDYDFDHDFLETSEEIKLCNEKYFSTPFNFDPTVPDLWGFFERGSDSGWDVQDQEFDFNLFIPNTNPLGNFMYINVNEGTVTGVMVDDDTLTYQAQTFMPGNHYLINAASGYHKVIGKVSGDFYQLEFFVDISRVPVVYYPEFSDIDADGVKDSSEAKSGLNIFNPDTDEDGIFDGFDQSPLSKLILPSKRFLQIVYPTQIDKTTIISLQLKKPSTDYTSNRRLWRDSIEVSIAPAVRVFGNPSMTLTQLETYSGKSALSFNLTGDLAYNLGGSGDAVPNTNNPDGPFTIVPIKYSDTAWDANIIYPPNHAAKTGANSPGTLDLRIDFVWMVLQNDPKTGNTSILHYYPIEEPITIAAMTTQENGQINYVYATPDTFIEHKIIDGLVENPTLGAFADYGVGDDILAVGTGTFDQFLNDLLVDVKDLVIPSDQNQVIYATGKSKNVDLLNQINIIQNNLSDSLEANEGEYETSFVLNSIYGGTQELNQDIISNGNYRLIESTFNPEEDGRLPLITILDRTISIKVNNLIGSYSCIEFTKVAGNPIDFLDSKSLRFDNLPTDLQIIHQTYLQLNTQPLVGQIPSLLFNKNTDIQKVSYKKVDTTKLSDDIPSTPEQNTDLSEKGLNVDGSPLPPAQCWVNDFDILYNQYVDLLQPSGTWSGTWDDISSVLGDLEMDMSLDEIDDLIKFVKGHTKFDSLFREFRDYRNYINSLNEQGSAVPLCTYGKVEGLYDTIEAEFNYADDLVDDYLTTYYSSEKLQTYYRLQEESHRTFHDSWKRDFVDVYGDEFWDDATDVHNSQRESLIWETDPSPCSTEMEINQQKMGSSVSARVLGTIVGGALIIIGGFLVVTSLLDIINNIKAYCDGTGDTSGAQLALRLGKSLAQLAMGLVLVKMGVLVLQKTWGSLTQAAFEEAMYFWGVLTFVITVIIATIDILTIISQALNGELVGDALTYAITNWIIATIFAVAGGILAIGGYSIIAVAAALVYIGLQLLSSLVIDPLLNKPNIGPVAQDAYGVQYPIEQLQRDGSLTVGQTFGLSVNVNNSGNRPARYMAQLGVGGPAAADVNWGTTADTGYIEPNINHTIYMTATLDRPETNLSIHYQYYRWAQVVQTFLGVPIALQEVELAGGEWIAPLGGDICLPVLESNIAWFFENTQLLQEVPSEGYFSAIQKALQEFRFKDAFALRDQLAAEVEAEAKMPWATFASLMARAVPCDYVEQDGELIPQSYKIQTTDAAEFHTLLVNYYWNYGFRASVPLSWQEYRDYDGQRLYYLNKQVTENYQNMELTNYFLNYYVVDVLNELDIVIPADQYNTLTTLMQDLQEVTDLLAQVPIQTNIKLKQLELGSLDPATGQFAGTIEFVLDGPDDPKVTASVMPPEGFTTSTEPSWKWYYLGSEGIPITVTASESGLPPGLYFITVGVQLWQSGYLVFDGQVAIRNPVYHDIQGPGPLGAIPGETYEAATLTNNGNVGEAVSFILTTDLPAEWYEITVPSPIFLEPQQSLPFLTITVPRHYTTVPATYFYTIDLFDAFTGEALASFTQEVQILPFYDIGLQGTHLDLTATDKDSLVQTPGMTCWVEVTNWGNVLQRMHVSPTCNWYVIDGVVVSETEFDLEPGASKIVELTFIPADGYIGTWDYSVEVASQYNSTWIEGTMTIVDDDTEPPVIETILLMAEIAPNTFTDDLEEIVVKVRATDEGNGIWGVCALILPNYIPPGIILLDEMTPLVDGWYTVTAPSPQIPGTYTLRVTVMDADQDYYWDPLRDTAWTYQDFSISIVDGDTTPPAINSIMTAPISKAALLAHAIPTSSAPVPDTAEYVLVSINATDEQSGIVRVLVQYGGKAYQAGRLENGPYLVLLPNPGTPGTYTMTITAEDDDRDWDGDSLTTQATASFMVVSSPPTVSVYYTNGTLPEEYPATWTFSVVDETQFPTGWMISPDDAPAGTWAILPEYDGHNTVLQLNSFMGEGDVSIFQEFPETVTSGSVEFWGTTEGIGTWGGLYMASESVPFIVFFNTTDVVFMSPDILMPFATISPGWHHYRVDFGTPELGANLIRVSIDEAIAGTFDLGAPFQLPWLGFLTAPFWFNTQTENGSLYLDAIGVTWDEDYVAGMNLVPSVPRVPLGNPIAYPPDYTGEYAATYTFREEELASFLDTWYMYPESVTYNILPEYAGHQTVLHVGMTCANQLGLVYNALDTNQAAGAVEFWYAIEGDGAGYVPVFYTESSSFNPALACWANGTIAIINEQLGITPVTTINGAGWHHYRVEFATAGATYLDLAANQFRVYIDQVPIGTFDFAAADPVRAISFYFGTPFMPNTVDFYIDAVGYSWDPDYVMGQNLVVSGPPAVPVLTIDEGEVAATLTWVPSDFNFGTTSYDIYRNGTWVANGTWANGTHVIMDISTLAGGTYLFEAVFEDGIGGVATSSIIVHVIGLQDRLTAAIDALIVAIEASSDADWRCPATCRKQIIIHELQEVKALLGAGDYDCAYAKLLRDIKPKLTGLMTDENETAWGHGAPCRPWVTSAALQQAFKDQINLILRGIKYLADTTPQPPCHHHHGCHHHGHHTVSDHHCDSHHGHHHGGPHHGCGIYSGSGHPLGCHV